MINLQNADNVWYVYEYIPLKQRQCYPKEKIEISEKLINYKKLCEDELVFFTSVLVEAIKNLSSNKIFHSKIGLISVPPSEVNKKSPVALSINKIYTMRDKFDKDIYDFSKYIYRISGVNTAHLAGNEERPTFNDHIRSLKCSLKEASEYKDFSFIIIDDITTTGTVMKACEHILEATGIPSDSIYKLAIAKTK